VQISNEMADPQLNSPNRFQYSALMLNVVEFLPIVQKEKDGENKSIFLRYALCLKNGYKFMSLDYDQSGV
jgi:hypothetical protein